MEGSGTHHCPWNVPRLQGCGGIIASWHGLWADMWPLDLYVFYCLSRVYFLVSRTRLVASCIKRAALRVCVSYTYLILITVWLLYNVSVLSCLKKTPMTITLLPVNPYDSLPALLGSNAGGGPCPESFKSLQMGRAVPVVETGFNRTS